MGRPRASNSSMVNGFVGAATVVVVAADVVGVLSGVVAGSVVRVAAGAVAGIDVVVDAVDVVAAEVGAAEVGAVLESPPQPLRAINATTTAMQRFMRTVCQLSFSVSYPWRTSWTWCTGSWIRYWAKLYTVNRAPSLRLPVRFQ